LPSPILGRVSGSCFV